MVVLFVQIFLSIVLVRISLAFVKLADKSLHVIFYRRDSPENLRRAYQLLVLNCFYMFVLSVWLLYKIWKDG